jgi:hypothetical protein
VGAQVFLEMSSPPPGFQEEVVFDGLSDTTPTTFANLRTVAC